MHRTISCVSRCLYQPSLLSCERLIYYDLSRPQHKIRWHVGTASISRYLKALYKLSYIYTSAFLCIIHCSSLHFRSYSVCVRLSACLCVFLSLYFNPSFALPSTSHLSFCISFRAFRNFGSAKILPARVCL